MQEKAANNEKVTEAKTKLAALKAEAMKDVAALKAKIQSKINSK